MKYIFKQSVIPVIYLLCSAMMGLGIMVLEEKFLILEVALNVVNLLGYSLIVCATSFKDGQKALDLRETNDKSREIIARTGENLRLQTEEEFAVWKGFAYGAFACLPLVALLLIHTIVFLSGGLNTVGMIAGILYMPVYSFFLLFGHATSYTYYFALLALPYISALTGISYWLGAKKAMLKYESIDQMRKSLHGE